MRRGVILGVALIAISLALQASSAKPISFTTREKIRPYIQGTHLTRPLVFDKGTLRLDPPEGTPAIAEARALTLWQSRSLGCCQFVSDVEVFLADASVASLPKIHPPEGFAAPTFRARLAWVFINGGGPHGCGARLGPLFHGDRQTVPEPTHVMMIAADQSGQGVEYSTAGAFCGYPSAPAAQAATYGLSVPWRLASERRSACLYAQSTPLCKGGIGTIATVEITTPGCAKESGGSTGSSPGKPTTLQVFVEVPMTGGPCPSVTRRSDTQWEITGEPVLQPTGLIPSLRTGPDKLTYFDGNSHTLRFS